MKYITQVEVSGVPVTITTEHCDACGEIRANCQHCGVTVCECEDSMRMTVDADDMVYCRGVACLEAALEEMDERMQFAPPSKTGAADGLIVSMSRRLAQYMENERSIW